MFPSHWFTTGTAMPTRVTGACPASPCTPAGFPTRTRLTASLAPVTVQGGHESLAHVTGKEGGAAEMTETARFALPELGVPGRRPACSHMHTPPQASQQQPEVGVCATAVYIFSHRQLTSGKRLGTVDQMIWVVSSSPQPALLVGDLAHWVLSPAVPATHLGNKVNFST